MLTADAFGVMPPIARLTPAQAMYHFLSGYTAKVAGTEKGVTEPQATFSTCFGAPFMPRHPSEYGNLLKELIAKHGRLLAGEHRLDRRPHGVGHRMPIKATRRGRINTNAVRAPTSLSVPGHVSNAAVFWSKSHSGYFRFRCHSALPHTRNLK
jgi:ATP-dependent phosphoenolpyruvate carboxykinase